jgi:ribA/ribD-fused uncharacterized protein
LPGPPSRSAGIGSGAAKRLDRQVAGFDEQEWARRRLGIVVTGDLAKFGRHPSLLDFLLATGGKALAEAAPNDRIGGIGLAATDERAGLPERWPGLNLLGCALMEVRHQLAARGPQRLPSTAADDGAARCEVRP